MPGMLGIGLALIASVAWGASAVCVRAGLQQVNASLGTLISLVASLLVALAVALIVAPNALLSVSLTALAWFAVIGILQFPMGRFFNYQAVSRIGIARSIPLISTAPVFAVIFAILFTGETMTPFLALGAISIVVGIYLIVTSGEM